VALRDCICTHHVNSLTSWPFFISWYSRTTRCLVDTPLSDRTVQKPIIPLCRAVDYYRD